MSYVVFIAAPPMPELRGLHEGGRYGSKYGKLDLNLTFDRAMSRQSRRALTLQSLASLQERPERAPPMSSGLREADVGVNSKCAGASLLPPRDAVAAADPLFPSRFLDCSGGHRARAREGEKDGFAQQFLAWHAWASKHGGGHRRGWWKFLWDEDLKRTIDESARLERQFASYFDATIVNHAFDKTYDQLRDLIERTKTEQQWVPVSWVF
ncbi:MAGUK p55 subfamily member 6-like [Tropilaelaps mercedesae]|uniref:MAGUK p55 subfamily member 6-like n=1 Tax=Tropilaelaps mercedesae TaxID=418985 RepID=A0A1V9WZD5_9ACAR|nr:MAGUK p55 subfamily member 6-like [Tropilaelaps mercedesae]